MWALSIELALARALAEVHSITGGGHGSLKPSNVVVVHESGRVVLLDYGLNAIKSNQGTMTVVPSVAYMAPEQLRGADEGPEGDMFTFGTLLYEMLMRAPAFDGSNAMEVGRHILAGNVPDAMVADSDGAVCGLIQRCWSVDPLVRPMAQEAADVLAAARMRARCWGE